MELSRRSFCHSHPIFPFAWRYYWHKAGQWFIGTISAGTVRSAGTTGSGAEVCERGGGQRTLRTGWRRAGEQNGHSDIGFVWNLAPLPPPPPPPPSRSSSTGGGSGSTLHRTSCKRAAAVSGREMTHTNKIDRKTKYFNFKVNVYCTMSAIRYKNNI